ncbi:Subtilisin-like serine endopeptidase family protein isoform 1 [Hibiscus syriacus]|uniref:Subtilisin-like serine endopeptidase family protein isoform 1 n=1 Tax=Hibiscus syriacus TaxID=106335 RepID=A0A6A3BHS4_HIBSY|nr:Subtilisin-like serine endopeptidase family protein isoform 1 [Hibiscus syriacus]
MPRAASNIMLALCVVLSLYSTRGGAVSAAGLPGSYPAILAFGDSILDSGNNILIGTLTKCNYPPYGRDFPGGISTGRFGNGKVFSDLIAERSGIKAILTAFLDPNLKDEDLVTGVCFASGGSGLDQQTANLQNVLSITAQFNLFKQYVGKLEGYVGTEKAQGIISQSLYLVSSGNNDICHQIFFDSEERLRCIHNTTGSMGIRFHTSKENRDMYGLGARKFAYLTTLPLGCLPSARITAGGILGNCFEMENQAAALFNSKLEAEVTDLNNNLPGADIFLLDIYSPLLEIIQNPDKYGRP